MVKVLVFNFCYYQYYICCKYNDGLERVAIEFKPVIILEEDGFYQWADQYDQWDNTFYTPVECFQHHRDQTRWDIEDQNCQWIVWIK